MSSIKRFSLKLGTHESCVPTEYPYRMIISQRRIMDTFIQEIKGKFTEPFTYIAPRVFSHLGDILDFNVDNLEKFVEVCSEVALMYGYYLIFKNLSGNSHNEIFGIGDTICVGDEDTLREDIEDDILSGYNFIKIMKYFPSMKETAEIFEKMIKDKGRSRYRACFPYDPFDSNSFLWWENQADDAGHSDLVEEYRKKHGYYSDSLDEFEYLSPNPEEYLRVYQRSLKIKTNNRNG